MSDRLIHLLEEIAGEITAMNEKLEKIIRMNTLIDSNAGLVNRQVHKNRSIIDSANKKINKQDNKQKTVESFVINF